MLHRRYLLLLVFCLLLCTVSAQADYVSGQWQYTVNDQGQAVITAYLGTETDIVMNWQLDQHLIAEIGEGAFWGNEALRSIQLPVGVRILRMDAFRNCSALTNVGLPPLLETIEDGAFRGCDALAELHIPDSVAEFGEYCFEPTTRLTGNPNGIAGAYASAMGMEYEDVEQQIEVIEDNPEDDYQYRIENGAAIVTAYIGDDYRVVVPAQLGGYPVKQIGENAFSSCYSVEEVILPEGLERLDRCAFRFCHYMMRIELPSTLRTIGEYCFYRCERLEEITLPDGLEKLENRAFQGCLNLKKVTLSAKLKTIPYYTFFECHAQLTLHAPAGSEAQNHAWIKGYRFVAENP